MSGHERGLPGLVVQFLGWVQLRPRTYAETMDAWRTTCPRLSVWEDALAAGLVALEAAPLAPQGDVGVRLTTEGQARLAMAAAAA